MLSMFLFNPNGKLFRLSCMKHLGKYDYEIDFLMPWEIHGKVRKILMANQYELLIFAALQILFLMVEQIGWRWHVQIDKRRLSELF